MEADSKKRRVSAFLLVTVFLSSGAGCQFVTGRKAEGTHTTFTQEKIDEQQLEREAYAVCSAYLNSPGSSTTRRLVIEDETEYYLLFRSSEDKEKAEQERSVVTEPTFEDVRKELPQAEAETLSDYITRNRFSSKLMTAFDLKSEYAIVSKKDLNEIFSNKEDDGWEMFHKKYPGADGIWRLSKPGFNAAMTQAFLYVSYGCGWLCGSGQFVLLEKQYGIWIERGVMILWQS